MNGMRKAVCFLLAMMLAAIALPGLAAPQYSKLYELTFTSDPTPPLAQLKPTVVVDLTNKALGPGNSNIGSFQLTFTGATIYSVTTNPPLPPQNIQVNGSTVFVLLGTSPLKANKTIELTIELNDCGDGISLQEADVKVWTGNMGQTFSPTVTFPLTTSVVCGNIACGDTNVTVPTSQPGSVTVTRDFYDKDGATVADFCDTVPYTVTNTVSIGGKQVHFAWPDDNSGDPAAAFEFTVANGGTALTLIAWLNTDGSSTSLPGTPDYILADACLANANFLPKPYGTLVNDVLAGATTIRVDPANPTGAHPAIAHPGGTFDIVIDTERMTVTAVDAITYAPNEDWTVTRSVAFTGPAGGVFHSHIAQVSPLVLKLAMSTPLPIMTSTQGVIGQYVIGHQAQGCIEAQGTFPFPPNTTTYISVGDPWASQP